MLAWVMVASSWLACAPATVQLARTTGKGEIQVGLEPGITGAASESVAVAPSFNLAVRYGLTDRLDFGGRVGTSVYAIDLKYMITEPAATDTVAISIAPSTTLIGGGLGGASLVVWDTRVPVLFGVPVDRSELTLGPNLRTLMATGGGGGATGAAAVLTAGATVGFAARAADGLRIMPQLEVGIPVAGAGVSTSDSTVAVDLDGVLFGAQLGFLVGGPE